MTLTHLLSQIEISVAFSFPSLSFSFLFAYTSHKSQVPEGETQHSHH